MSKICQITGKKAQIGNNVSHSKHRTKRSFDVNLFSKKFYYVEKDMWISLKISAAGLRLINKVGLDAAVKQAIEKGYLTEKELYKDEYLYFEHSMANKKAKGNRVQVILECTEMKNSGLPGTSRYITTKNRKNTAERLELMKYNPILKKMTLHKEIK